MDVWHSSWPVVPDAWSRTHGAGHMTFLQSQKDEPQGFPQKKSHGNTNMCSCGSSVHSSVIKVTGINLWPASSFISCFRAKRKCRKRDLNPHSIATTGTWSLRVCQFRHSCICWYLMSCAFSVAHNDVYLIRPSFDCQLYFKNFL